MEVLIPRIVAPRTLTDDIKPKTYLIQDKVPKKEPPKLLVAVGAGGVPPSGDGFPSLFKKPFSKEALDKIKIIIKDTNKLARKNFYILNKYYKIIK